MHEAVLQHLTDGTAGHVRTHDTHIISIGTRFMSCAVREKIEFQGCFSVMCSSVVEVLFASASRHRGPGSAPGGRITIEQLWT